MGGVLEGEADRYWLQSVKRLLCKSSLTPSSWRSPAQKHAFFFPRAVNAKIKVPWPLALAATKLLWETENKGASRCKVDSFTQFVFISGSSVG